MTTQTTTKTTRKRKVSTNVETPISLPDKPFAFEVLSVVSNQKTDAQKVEVLKQYDDPSLKSILIWNFDESIVSELPPGEVPYSSTNEQTSYSGTLSEKINDAVTKMDEINTNSLGASDQGKSSIREEYKMFYNFVRGGNPTLTSLRRETMFINILEGLHPREAEILVLVKDKKLQQKYNITKQIISEAYPDIIWGINRS